MRSEHPLTRDEQDACTGWRRYLRWRPGERKAIKVASHRLDRRTWRSREGVEA